MPFGIKVECSKCNEDISLLWHVAEEKFFCHSCFDQLDQSSMEIKLLTGDENNKNNGQTEGNMTLRKSTRSTRSYRTRLNPNAIPKHPAPKGRGRRHIFKRKPPVKSPASVSETITCRYTFHNETFLRVGDIVALKNFDGKIYYAQLRGLMVDQYSQKSGVITWLVPIPGTDLSKSFDPTRFIYGPVEDIPRDLDCMEFVMHAPSDYFKLNNPPYPPLHQLPSENGYIWTNLKV